MSHHVMCIVTVLAFGAWSPFSANAQSTNDVSGRAEPTIVPRAIVESWSNLIGHWDVEGRIGPTPVKGTAYFDWAKGRHCYVGSQVWTIGEDSHTTHLALIGGWDAAANETVEQGFSSTGDAATVRYSTRAPGESPEVIVGQIAGVSGPDRHWQGIVERNQFGPNKFTITTTVDGDILHSLTYVRCKVLQAATDAPRNERESP